MADTQVATGLTVAQWDDKFFVEHLSQNRFEGEMGTDENSIIQVKEDLTKKKGDRIHFALVNKLTQEATTGSDVLEGNEEDMDTRSFPLAIDKRRHAVRVSELQEQFSAIDLRDGAKIGLKRWAKKDTEHLIIKALGRMGGIDMNVDDVALPANQAALDAWLVDNADRVYFDNKAYTTMTDLSAGLATLTAGTAAELLTIDNLDEMKFIATTRANPKIVPVTSESNGRDYFTVYTHPLAFKDLKKSSAIQQAQREVALEMENNRLFKGGDLLWNGMIIKEVHDMYGINTLTGLGDSSTVVPAFLCGAQAVGMAWARRFRTKEKEFDYGDKHGVAIDGIYGVDKLTFGSGNGDRDDPKDHGVVTGFFASSTAS